jgi:hypothetical protein
VRIMDAEAFAMTVPEVAVAQQALWASWHFLP